jgi:hypothetical protein
MELHPIGIDSGDRTDLSGATDHRFRRIGFFGRGRFAILSIEICCSRHSSAIL